MAVWLNTDTLPWHRATCNQFRFYDSMQTFRGRTYYENGHLSQVLNFRNGKLQGEYGLNDSLGIPIIVGQFFKGAKVGVWAYYHSNGQLRSRGSYYPKVLTFEWQGYFGEHDSIAVYGLDHIFIEKISYSSERYSYYSPPKELKGAESFSSGALPSCRYFKHGIWHYFNEEGDLVKTEKWDKGERVK
jgi:antitoxin component YwqK of YwqJK toxin-antitoxin module